jgi:outer membrane protein assembly factor BamD (BamD/ComL family)
MKKYLLICLLSMACVTMFSSTASAQTGPAKGPDQSTVRDAEAESDSMANLGKARFYFKLRKAYLASLNRCEEVLAGNPNFSKIDEVLYLAGVSSLRLSEKKGKQGTKTSPERLRDDARAYLSQLVNEHPDSPFRKQAEDELRSLGGVKPKN